ncbi:MAG: OFA family MFS transporter [Eubacteriaceae bacterium]|nr:OFA family MFS transporter [Eubacteriaceae bacterium]
MNEVSIIKVNRTKVLFMGMFVQLTAGMLYSWSVIQPFIMKHYSMDTSAASIPFSVNLALFVVGSIIGGKLQGKFLIQKSLFTGIIINFAGLLLTAFVPVQASWLIIVSFGLLCGIGTGIVYNTLIAAMQKYFPDRKGMATGCILCMIGVSGFILAPFISYLLNNYSLSLMFMILAFVTLAVGVIGAIFIKNPPEGYMADYNPNTVKVASTSKNYEPKEMLKTKYYYLIAFAMLSAVLGFMLINPQFVVMSKDRLITPAQALTAVMFASIFQAAGRLLVPSISDKVGRKITLLVVFICSAAVIIGIVGAKGLLYPILFVALAFFYGGFLGTFPALSTDYFGIKNAGINYAFVMIGFGAASVLCPILVRAVRGTAMGTAMSFAIAGAAAIIGLILLIRLKKPN